MAISSLYEKNEEEREKIKNELKELLEKGNKTIYQVALNVGSYGTSRTIANFIATGKGEIINIDWYICKILSYVKFDDDRRGTRVYGCGMDMGFYIVYHLGIALYNDGYALTQKWLN